MINTNKSLIHIIVFIVILINIFFFLNLDDIFLSGPQGIHFMRQTDSLSFASRYFNNGFDFFNPQLFNLKNINGNAACEFPITYYLTALLYSVFGKKIFILKLLHYIIISIGIFHLFKLSLLLLKDYFYAIVISLFLFTSTVFNYYSFNYLPDAPALGFTFIGWYFAFKYLIKEEEKNKTILTAFIFFTIASLIKVTYLINPLSVIGFSLFSIIFNQKKTIENGIAKKIITYGIIGVFIVIAWNTYILYYNTLYNSSSFNTTALPIWSLTINEIKSVWDHITNYWHFSYFAKRSFYLLFLLLSLQVIFHKKTDSKLSLITLILFLGAFAYFLLFYSQFKDHDYYFLTFIPLITLVLINGIKTWQNIFNNRYLNIATKLAFTIVLISGLNYSKLTLANRNNKKVDYYSKMGLLINENSNSIDSLNISNNSKFIIGPDPCQNGGLFFLNRMGWTIDLQEDITINKINHYKDLGAEYLILTSDTSVFSTDTGNSTGKLILKGKGINIFKLENTTSNTE